MAYSEAIRSNFKKLQTTDWHFLWVILFFVIHGYTQYLQLIPLAGVLWLFVKLTAAGIIVFWLCSKLFNSKRKAGIFTSFVAIMVLFFGVMQDFVAQYRPTAFLASLRVFAGVTLLIIIAVFLWLKWSGRKFNKTVVFVNTLFFIFIMVDLVTIIFYSVSSNKNQSKFFSEYKLSICDTCKKPPVYLIMLDEYFGADGLKEYFKYDNAAFENFLSTEGFKVVNHANSNYAYTVYSIAALFNMGYIDALGPQTMKNHYGYKKSLALIRNNVVFNFFDNHGYRIANYSSFDFENVPASIGGLLTDKIRLITSQTMYYRVAKNFPNALRKVGINTGIQKKLENKVLLNNEAVLNDALKNANDTSRVFAYLHLMLPHIPYVYDSVGNRIVSFSERKHFTLEDADNAYLQQLIYTNKKIGQFILELKKATAQKAIIIVMSDHGFRGAARKNIKFAYQNFNAIYLPAGNYKAWYNGISNVNQFRVLLNTEFGQQLPLLKDSIVK